MLNGGNGLEFQSTQKISIDTINDQSITPWSLGSNRYVAEHFQQSYTISYVRQTEWWLKIEPCNDKSCTVWIITALLCLISKTFYLAARSNVLIKKKRFFFYICC